MNWPLPHNYSHNIMKCMILSNTSIYPWYASLFIFPLKNENFLLSTSMCSRILRNLAKLATHSCASSPLALLSQFQNWPKAILSPKPLLGFLWSLPPNFKWVVLLVTIFHFHLYLLTNLHIFLGSSQHKNGFLQLTNVFLYANSKSLLLVFILPNLFAAFS